MKKIFILSAIWFVSIAATAQEAYEISEIMHQDLNGTARYIGMGGAMDALGADISTMSSNPAGIGLFRRNQVSLSLGFINQNGSEFEGIKPSMVSFDQAGVVISTNTSFRKQSYLNFGFNYSKSRNYRQLIEAGAQLYGASQTIQTCGKGMTGIFEYNNSVNQVDHLYGQAGFIVGDDKHGYDYFYNEGENYDMERGVKGHTNNFDFNLSGNINNRIFLGITFGIKDLTYRATSSYYEWQALGSTSNIYDERDLDGTGFDIKLGAIVRPIEESPFRIGLSISTPTWYRLTSSNFSEIAYSYIDKPKEEPKYITDWYTSQESYRYHFSTPWNFGISLGHTIGDKIALGASYNYADYSATTARISDGYDTYYDYYGSYSSEHTLKDKQTSRQLSKTLEGVHNVKVGAEIKPIPELAVRVGYNYVSSMYNSDGMKDPTLCTIGNYYMSQTDYTNWKATNRFTCGLGFQIDNFGLDLSYQYSMRKGDFYPFSSGTYDFTTWDEDGEPVNVTLDNTVSACEVKDNRHQVLMTLSYKF